MQTERVFRVLLAVFGQCNQSFVQLGGKLSFACLVSIFIAPSFHYFQSFFSLFVCYFIEYSRGVVPFLHVSSCLPRSWGGRKVFTLLLAQGTMLSRLNQDSFIYRRLAGREKGQDTMAGIMMKQFLSMKRINGRTFYGGDDSFLMHFFITIKLNVVELKNNFSDQVDP